MIIQTGDFIHYDAYWTCKKCEYKHVIEAVSLECGCAYTCLCGEKG